MSVGTILGGVVGGVAGWFVGGPAGAWKGASLGATVGGGIDQKSTADRNASELSSIGKYNSNQIIMTGDYNARSTMALAGLNSAAALMGARVGAEVTMDLAEFNAGLQLQTAEYNALLMENEASLTLDAVELDIIQYRKRADLQQGTATAVYGASGVLIDERGDTPSQVLLDMQTEEEFEVAIMNHNGDIVASKYLDMAAIGRWEGDVMAKKIIFEGQSGALMTLASGGFQSLGFLAQGAIDSEMIRWNAMMDSNNTLRNSGWASSQSTQAGNQAFMNGVLTAGTMAAGYYGMKKPTVTVPKTSAPPTLLRAPGTVGAPAGYTGNNYLLGSGSSLLNT